MNGIGGYSLLWTQSSTTIPDTIIDTAGTSVTSSALADGTWYLHIRTVDGVENWNSGAYHVGPFLIDNTAPGQPVVTGPVAWSNHSTPQFSWSAPSDLSGITGYSYSVDNPPDDSVDTTSTSITTSTLGDGSHQFFVKARDAADNWGLPRLYSFSLDFANPTLAISSPVESAVQNTSSINVGWAGSDSLSGINHYEVQLDANSPIDVGVSTSRLFGSVPDGRHVVRVKAVDNAVNAITVMANLTVDTVVPQASISVSGTEGSAGWFVSAVSVTITPSDATSGVNFTKYSIDSGGLSSYSSGFPLAESGVYEVSYYCQDFAGNSNPVATSTIRVDLQAPSLSFTDLEDGATFTSKSIAVSWSSEDNISGLDHYEYKLDSGSYQSLAQTSSVGLSDLPAGQHTLTVRSVDVAGNVAEKNLTFNVETSVFSMSGPVGPWLDVGLAIVAIVVIALAVILLRRRKGKSKPSTPEDTKSQQTD
jgi:hypothetical protein